MKASHKFLKLYVPDLNETGKEFSERITMTGTKIETYEVLNKNLSKIVVGQLKEVKKHPDADKLSVCQVDIGNEIIQIITGAGNIYEGMLCPCVLDGGKVASSAHDNEEHPNGISIKKGKLRGLESNGMLCSVSELGRPDDLYEKIDGIYDMSHLNVKPGDDAIKALWLDDCLYDFEITSNRIDCYSVKGIAKEVAATFNCKYVEPTTKYNVNLSEKNYIDLEVKDKDLCKVYSTRLIKNVKIKESPEWLKNCLRAVGIRPINNIVDITNFVMIEYGQPMHAFDYGTLRDKKIVVKRATDGEKFITLDKKEHVLNKDMLTICDGEGAIALAGIMGGENSMITENATSVMFESANFDGVNIRKSSKKLGFRTESSNLFEKGLDPYNALKALDRACALVEELEIGQIVKEEISYVSDDIFEKRNISVDYGRVNSLLGTNFSAKDMKNILDKIDLFTEIKGDKLFITVPSIRKDINNFADIAEEVIRFYGYDKIGMSLPNVNIIPKLKSDKETIEELAYNISLYNGFNETMNYSFESEKVYDKLKYKENAKERDYIKILNPLGEDFSVMRTQLVNGILSSIGNNYRNHIKNVKLFEIANVYIKKDEEIKVLPDENKTLVLGAYGDNFDYYDMKAVCDEYFKALGINDIKIKYVADENISFLHPFRAGYIYIEDECIGFIGEVHKSVCEMYGIEDKCYISSVNLSNLTKYADFTIKYKEISRFPNIERDLSMLVPSNITSYEIEQIIKQRGGKLLINCKLFDIYEGKQVKEGYKSLAYSLEFLSKDHTLTVEEIDKIILKIINGLNQIGIELRS